MSFLDSYERSRKQLLPSADSKLKHTAENDRLTGSYKNKKGWPEIEILKAESSYILTWGDLSGPIFGIPDAFLTSWVRFCEHFI